MCQKTLTLRQNVKGTHSQSSRQGNSVSERNYFCHHPKELSQSEIVRRSNLEWNLKKQICRRNLENRAIAIGSKASERTQHIMNLFKNQRRRTETKTLDRKCSWQNNYLLQKLLAWWRTAKERTSKTAWNVETGKKNLTQKGFFNKAINN